MEQDLTDKKYPSATDEVAKMLGIHPDSQQTSTAAAGHLPVANLPVANEEAASEDAAGLAALAKHKGQPKEEISAPAVAPWMKIARAAGPYVAVFAVGLFLYYFFFSSSTGLHFGFLSNLFTKSESAPAKPQQTALQQLENQDQSAYRQWINGFYYDVTDPKVIDPETDNSGNGLTNFQKYLLNLNPKSYDTLGLGMPDSQTLADNINPLTGASLTDAQKQVISKYIDMETVMNRLTLESLQRQSRVAGASTLASYTPGVPGGTENGQLNPALENSVDINTSISGRLDIPDLKISVPIIWTQDTNNFDRDLQSGVVHYPGTAMPGQIGTTYIAGHSSNYPWAKGSYNRIFSTLGNLGNNTSFSLTVTQTNGKTAVFHYVVVNRQQYAPTDQAQFQNTGKSLVALSTCWPVGSTAKRLVIFGELTQVEQ